MNVLEASNTLTKVIQIRFRKGEYNPVLKLCIGVCKDLGVTLSDLFLSLWGTPKSQGDGRVVLFHHQSSKKMFSLQYEILHIKMN